MKIDNTYTNYELEKISPKAGKPVMATPESPSESGSPDKQGAPRDAIVNLSQASKEASLMENAIAEAPDIRQDKVLALKEKTREGQSIRKLYDLELARSTSPLFALSWVVMHEINVNSPLKKLNEE